MAANWCEKKILSLVVLALETNSSSNSSSSSSSSDSEPDVVMHMLYSASCPDRKRKFRRLGNSFEDLLSMYSPDDFRSHFRMKRSTVEFLILKVTRHITNCHGDGRPTIDPCKQVLMSLWVLANQDTYRSISERFGVPKQTVWQSSMRVWKTLLELAPQFVSWPEGIRQEKTINGFKAIAFFPGILGVIGCLYIAVKTPKKDSGSYVNRKGFHAIAIQAVCDNRCRFTDIDAGHAGSIPEAKIFQNSDLNRRIDKNSNLLPINTHLLGNLAYPLSQQILTPFKDTEKLTGSEKLYNVAHAKTHNLIEHSFGILKGRFRRLNFLDMWRTDLVPLVILASCVLHNLCELQKDHGLEFYVDLAVNMDIKDIISDPCIEKDHCSGQKKRTLIAEEFKAIT